MGKKIDNELGTVSATCWMPPGSCFPGAGCGVGGCNSWNCNYWQNSCNNCNNWGWNSCASGSCSPWGNNGWYQSSCGGWDCGRCWGPPRPW